MNAPHPKPSTGTSADPIAGALAAMLKPLIAEAMADALAELQDGQRPTPALLTVAQICAAIQVSRSKFHKLRLEGLPSLLVGDSPRFELAAVLEWLKGR